MHRFISPIDIYRYITISYSYRDIPGIIYNMQVIKKKKIRKQTRMFKRYNSTNYFNTYIPQYTTIDNNKPINNQIVLLNILIINLLNLKSYSIIYY